MEKVIEILNLQADGVIEKFAIGRGIATIRYLPPYETDDIDVFFPPTTVGEAGLLTLEPIYKYLLDLDYEAVKEGVVVEGWLVQFVPISNSLQEAAVEHAERVPFGEHYTFVFSAEYLAAELLRSGRPQDNARVIALLDSEELDMAVFEQIINRHGLRDKWIQFVRRFELTQYE